VMSLCCSVVVLPPATLLRPLSLSSLHIFTTHYVLSPLTHPHTHTHTQTTHTHNIFTTQYIWPRNIFTTQLSDTIEYLYYYIYLTTLNIFTLTTSLYISHH
jgi:hypothetical protein